jgi:hypothetical protein
MEQVRLPPDELHKTQCNQAAAGCRIKNPRLKGIKPGAKRLNWFKAPAQGGEAGDDESSASKITIGPIKFQQISPGLYQKISGFVINLA